MILNLIFIDIFWTQTKLWCCLHIVYVTFWTDSNIFHTQSTNKWIFSQTNGYDLIWSNLIYYLNLFKLVKFQICEKQFHSRLKFSIVFVFLISTKTEIFLRGLCSKYFSIWKRLSQWILVWQILVAIENEF